MDPRAPRRWSDVRAGALVLMGLIPLTCGVFFLDVLRRALVEGPALVVVADEIHGLAPGADVWVAGRLAGRVTAISFLDADTRRTGSIAIRLVLHHEAGPILRRDAEARIGSRALLAPPVVKLDPGSARAPPFDFTDTLTVSTRPRVEDFRALADSGRAAIGGLKRELEGLAMELRTGRGTLARLRRDPALRDRLAGNRARSARLRAAWSRGSGLGGLARDTSLHGAASRTADRIRELAASGTPDAETALGELSGALASVRSRAGRLARRLDAAEGTLGRIATDDELRLQADRTRALIDSLKADVAADPLRFLHFRLF